MFKKTILTLGLLASSVSFATGSLFDLLTTQVNSQIKTQMLTTGIDFKVGEKNNYEVDFTIAKGTMVMEVLEISAEGIWVSQDMDLGPMGKQESKSLLDKDTGAVKKMLVGGKEQELPKSEMEMIETKEDKITVPAGTFDCIHARLKDKSNNEESNVWINPQAVSIGGMLKMVRPFQFGTVTAQLTNFLKK